MSANTKGMEGWGWRDRRDVLYFIWIPQVRPERFELPTLWFEARCSDPLSYGRVRNIIAPVQRNSIAAAGL
jgi:hypothetical protein